MVRSMTGYGRGERSFGKFQVTIEVRSVNNRYLDCTVKMPKAYIFAEEAIKAEAQSSIGRGKVDIFVTIVGSGEGGVSVTVNEALARSYMDALFKLYQIGKDHGIRQEYSPTDLANFPDVLTVEKMEKDPEQTKEHLLEALNAAIQDFNTMREKEGQRLAVDILGRVAVIEELVAQVEQRSPQTVADYRARLESKLREVLGNTQIDESKILTEAAVFADKVAVDEETVRLRSHIGQLRALLSKGGQVGRKLDFLIQEFNRETNTIGSKCSDLWIIQIVVDIKAEIEKIREQIQNLE